EAGAVPAGVRGVVPLGQVTAGVVVHLDAVAHRVVDGDRTPGGDVVGHAVGRPARAAPPLFGEVAAGAEVHLHVRVVGVEHGRRARPRVGRRRTGHRFVAVGGVAGPADDAVLVVRDEVAVGLQYPHHAGERGEVRRPDRGAGRV